MEDFIKETPQLKQSFLLGKLIMPERLCSLAVTYHVIGRSHDTQPTNESAGLKSQ